MNDRLCYERAHTANIYTLCIQSYNHPKRRKMQHSTPSKNVIKKVMVSIPTPLARIQASNQDSFPLRESNSSSNETICLFM